MDKSLHDIGQRGMTLVELMVAMVVGLILLGGIYQIFTSSTTGYRENEQFARLQENARFAMEILSRDMRMAGYLGCNSNADMIENTLAIKTGVYAFDAMLQGFDPMTSDLADYIPGINTGNPADITDLAAGADIVLLRRAADGAPIKIENPMPANSSVLKVANGTTGITTGDILMINNCDGGAVFQVKNYSTSSGTINHGTGGTVVPGNDAKDLGADYGTDAEIVQIVSTAYFLRDVSGRIGLYRLQWSNPTELTTAVPEEILSDIEQMQIRYGIDNGSGGGSADDGVVDSYVSAAAVADWGQVVAVRAALLFRSDIIGKAPLDTTTYDLDGDDTTGVAGREYDPADERRMRRVFKMSVGIRNRLI